ncbi:MAG: GNAT family N-acetyltransferase [Acidobacteria bacterium]|nr:GNAT family N-acetyltransferase [Acidobacteriota bacterium]
MSATIEITPAESRRDVEIAREIFREYEAAIGIDLCFQSFEKELAELPGLYAPPKGRLYLLRIDGEVEGCIALRPSGEHDCEMKRLFVRPARRGAGAGRLLAERVIADARTIGYSRMLLDTLDSMQSAQRLYESLGFVDAEPYTHNPLTGVRYMQLDLRSMS